MVFQENCLAVSKAENFHYEIFCVGPQVEKAIVRFSCQECKTFITSRQTNIYSIPLPRPGVEKHRVFFGEHRTSEQRTVFANNMFFDP